jgi:Ca2+-binding RTX toxin-like protein
MVAGWTIGVRVLRAAGHRAKGMTRVTAAGLLVGVGLVGQAAPAEAVVSCGYDPDTDIASVTVQRRDGVSIGRDTSGNFVVPGVECGPYATVQTVHSMVIGADADNDTETVTLDLSHGGFVDDVSDPAAPREIDLTIDLGDRGTDRLVIEGANDISDDISVTGAGVDLNGNGRVDVTTSGVESLEIRGNAGSDTIIAKDATFGAGQPVVLSDSTANPGITLVGGDGDDILTGGGGDDVLAGSRGDDMLTGMDGNDRLDTGPGPGTLDGLMLDGGAGIDTADFSGMFVPVEANLGEGGAAYGEGGYDLDGMENLVGTAFADLLVGDDAANAIDCGGGDDETYGMGDKDRIHGGGGDDTLHGIGGGDSLDGGDGDDTLHGGDSGDGIEGGSGGDTIHGGGSSGSSNDVVRGETGSDVIYGGNGRQVIFAGDGLDEVYGEEGNDVVDGQDGEDMVFGGQGNDKARGGDGPDQVYGGLGSDSVDGDDGDDEVYGDSGSDHVDGGVGDDALFGGDSSDRLSDEDGDDVLNAGAGSDRLNGRRGDDILRGAAGTDTVTFADSPFGVTARLADGSASGDGEDALSGVENLWGSRHDDSLLGNQLRNQLRGGAGADVLAGGLGKDQESGGGGNDVLDQGRRRNGGDRLSGGAGRRDVVDYSARSHYVRVTRDGSGNDGERGEDDNIRGDIDRVRR